MIDVNLRKKIFAENNLSQISYRGVNYEQNCTFIRKELQDKIFEKKYYDKIREFGELYIYDKDSFDDEEYVLDFVNDAEIIITSWSSPCLSKKILDLCPNLKGVIHAAGTVKLIISPEFIKRKIRITNAAMPIGEGVAESALGLAISACKRFFWLNDDTAKGMWGENRENIKDFYDITVGIVSGGYVGRHMVKLLKNFHVDILMYDPILSAKEIQEIGAEKVELNSLISRSDVISIHAPSIPETDKMFNKENLALIKPGAVLINTSRGSVIDERALIEELKTNRFFACIDVTDPEPPGADNELRTLKNVILTPHIAGVTTNGMKRIAKHVCEEFQLLF